MNTLLTLSWRNIWRHPARSGVLIAAIIAGLWAGVFTVGLVNGLMEQRINYLITSEITHAQLHHPEFLSEGYSRLYIPGHNDITAWLDDRPEVRSYTSRTITDGMLQSPIKTSGVRIRGIDVRSETRTTDFHENMTEGEYLDSEIPNAIILGEILARDHNMEVGNRVVLTFEDTGNELTSAAFSIVGFFRSPSLDYDGRNVFVRSNELIALLSDKPVYHEIAMMLDNEEAAASVVSELNAQFSGIEAKTWRQLSPELSMYVELGGFMMIMITMIIMIALAFGILNTMLMALFERMRELGMLISIGMSRQRVFGMITLEAVILTMTGALTGIGLAVISINYFSDRGVNLEMFAEGAAQLGFDYHIFPVISTSEYVVILAVVILITLAASIYPAIKGVRVNPLEAARDA